MLQYNLIGNVKNLFVVYVSYTAAVWCNVFKWGKTRQDANVTFSGRPIPLHFMGSKITPDFCLLFSLSLFLNNVTYFSLTLTNMVIILPEETILLMKSIIFWDMMPCSPSSFNRCFGGTYRLHLHSIHYILLATCLLAGFCWTYFFDPEDWGDMFLRNVSWNSTDYMASYPRRWYSS
jgi:hypothetical protein